MAIMRWDPFTALARMDDEFDELVRRTFGSASYQYVPPVEMATDGADVLITLELPGVDPSSVDIEVVEGRLTISGERRERAENARGKVLVREVRYGAFRRTFQLPDGVSAGQIEAEADQGLLRIRVKNVTKPVEPPRKIQIKAGEQSRIIEAKRGEVQPGAEPGTPSGAQPGGRSGGRSGG
jgi:HSP20 family protein